MSLTLIITKRATRGLSLKNPLASRIIDQLGDVADETSVEFLAGVLAGLPDGPDRRTIAKMVECIKDGAVYDMREQY